jgi:hypothetical protein
MTLYGGFERPWPITSISYTEYVQVWVPPAICFAAIAK